MRGDYKNHFAKTWKLAFPICLSQLGHVMVGVADSIMVGNYGGEGSAIGALSLAGASLANSLFAVIIVFGVGVSFAVTPLVAAADGEKNTEKITQLLKHSILISTLLGLGLFVVLFFGSPLLNYLGQEEDVVALAIPYFNILVFSMIPLMIFLGFKQFSEGLSHTKQAMVITIAANILNVLLNYLLIYGNWGFPELGLNGAGWATFFARLVMAIAIGGFVYYHSFYKPYRGGFILRDFSKKLSSRIIKLGIPIGMQFTFEIGAFAFGAVMIGWIGAVELAAHQIAISLASVTYMLASGIASATTVRVGNQLGAQNPYQLRKAGQSGFMLVLAFMFIASIFFIVFNQQLPLFFNQRPDVVEIASSLIIIAALFQLSDGVQVLGLGALRGMSDVKIPTVITVVSYWLVALPMAYLLGFIFEFGAPGVWFGLLIGLTIAAVSMYYRFNQKSAL
ncbi:MAG: MATE family efflux transporter [Bacteroidetes bacterium]|nr:MATE family efflux transporter [Bacteroidota bacterium]